MHFISVKEESRKELFQYVSLALFGWTYFTDSSRLMTIHLGNRSKLRCCRKKFNPHTYDQFCTCDSVAPPWSRDHNLGNSFNDPSGSINDHCKKAHKFGHNSTYNLLKIEILVLILSHKSSEVLLPSTSPHFGTCIMKSSDFEQIYLFSCRSHESKITVEVISTFKLW